MIGFLETKVKDKNVNKVTGKTFPGWIWQHNFEYDAKDRIWIAWKPNSYNVQFLKMTDQLVHCYATQLNTHKKFYATFVYGMNQEQMRMTLCADLQALSQQINETWCILGDFNSVLYKEDRMRGIEVQDHEVQHLANLLDTCSLQELRWIGAYYSWSNKTIWSRIDRVFTNLLWYDTMEYTQTHYLPNGLSDHTSSLVKFPTSPRPQAKFQFYDMWCKHRDFAHIIASNLPAAEEPCKMI